MKNVTVAVAVALSCVLGLHNATAGTLSFGPQQYQRSEGGTNLFDDPFDSVPGPATLVVMNGESNGDKRVDNVVSSARVVLNGVEIFSPNDFNQNVYSLESPITLTATNNLHVELNGSPDSFLTIQVESPNTPPTITVTPTHATIQQGAQATLSWTSSDANSVHIDQGIGLAATVGSIVVGPQSTTTYTLTAMGDQGSTQAQAVVEVLGAPTAQPEGAFGGQYEDLIPPDATVTTYEPERFALITGEVRNTTGAAIPEVAITVLDHPAYGSVFTDASGRFTVPVEGGGTIALVYRKAGLVTVHRRVKVPWDDVAVVEPIEMIAEDGASTTVVFDGSSQTVVTHRSSAVTDAFGSRSATLVFTGDTTAYLVDEQGNDVQALPTITTRANTPRRSRCPPSYRPTPALPIVSS